MIIVAIISIIAAIAIPNLLKSRDETLEERAERTRAALLAVNRAEIAADKNAIADMIAKKQPYTTSKSEFASGQVIETFSASAFEQWKKDHFFVEIISHSQSPDGTWTMVYRPIPESIEKK